MPLRRANTFLDRRARKSIYRQLDPFEVDCHIDPADSEFKSQYLNIALENLLADDHPQELGAQLRSTPDMRLPDRVLDVLEEALNRARHRLKGGAAVRLLRCIGKVKAVQEMVHLQERLQNMVLQDNLEEERSLRKDLPKDMETPRCAMHSRDRLRLFRSQHHVKDSALYLTPDQPLIGADASLPPQPSSQFFKSRRTCSSSGNKVDGRTICQPLSAPVAGGVLQLGHSRQNVKRRDGGTCVGNTRNRSMWRPPSPSMHGQGLTWQTIWPEFPTLPSIPSRAVQVSKNKSGDGLRGNAAVSEMAGQVRIFAVDKHVRVVSASSANDVADDEDIEATVRPPRGEGIPAEPLVVPPPRLEGVTSGFSTQDPTPACPWVLKPPRLQRKETIGARICDLGTAVGADIVAENNDATDSSSRNSVADVARSECSEAHAAGTPLQIASGATTPQIASAPQNVVRSWSAPWVGAGLGGPARGKVSCGRWRLKGWRPKKPEVAHADADARMGSKNSDLKTHISSYLQQALSEKGLDSMPRFKRQVSSPSVVAGPKCTSSKHGHFATTRASSSHGHPATGKSVSAGTKVLRVLHDVSAVADLQPERCMPPECAAASSLVDAMEKQRSILGRCALPEVGYLKACAREKVNPRILKCLAERSSKLDLANMLIGDSDLDAVLQAMQSRLADPPGEKNLDASWEINEVDLSQNPRLTDAAVGRFISTSIRGNLHLKPCIHFLKTLRLSNCSLLGVQTFQVLGEILERNCELGELEVFDLCGVTVPSSCWPQLAEGIMCSRSIRQLLLARTGLGRNVQKDCAIVARFFDGKVCNQFEEIDISGNHFQIEGCQAVAGALAEASENLKVIDMSHNSWCQSGGPDSSHDDEGPVTLTSRINPIVYVLEVLGETTLERVSFANCQLSYEEDCVLEDVVASSEITHLDLSDNPHGEQGMRCLVRMIARRRDGTEIQSVGLSLMRDNILKPDTVTYDYSDPSANYRLDLSIPQHRAVLRLLLKRGEAATGGRGKEFDCFMNECFDKKSVSIRELCRKRLDRGGDDWQVPEEGVLSCVFGMPQFFDAKDGIDSCMKKYERSRKVRVDFLGWARIAKCFRQLHEHRSKQLVISAMSKDLVFKTCQVKHLCQMAPDLRIFIVSYLLAAVDQTVHQRVLFELVDSCEGKGSKRQVDEVRSICRLFLNFNACHPDGHYSLELANAVDRGVAARCIVVSSWYRFICEKNGWPDCSEHANNECLRNTITGTTSFVFDSKQWQLPDWGPFSFDFVTPRRPTLERAPIDVRVMEAMYASIEDSPCNYRDRISVLRHVCHRFVLTPDSLKQMLSLFPLWHPRYEAKGYQLDLRFVQRPRAEAYIVLYGRTLWHAEVVSPSLLYNPLIFHEHEVLNIQSRLGWIHTFDLINLHSSESNLGPRLGPFNMVKYDGWVIVKMLIMVNMGEKSTNFYDTWWSPKKKLLEQGYAFILPASWVPTQTHCEMPREGEFYTTWQSKEDEVNWQRRREIAETHLGLTFRAKA